MQGGHAEKALAVGLFEIDHLDDVRQHLRHIDKADDGNDEGDVQGKGQAAHHAPQKQRAGVPHKDLGGVEVIDEEKKRENWLLYLSETDRMTGICNRGCGERKISEMLDKHIGGLLCLIDCDKFKAINDTYGHAVGDSVIIAVAETLQNSCRENDIVLRLGGDEFAMYIPGLLDRQAADLFIERVFAAISSIYIPEMGTKQIYVSMGASFCLEDEEISFDRLYKEADEAMYQSKKVEGYCVTFYKHEKE